MKKTFGYFDDANREYVITDPATPWPWINYLGNEDFFSLISNTAGGYSKRVYPPEYEQIKRCIDQGNTIEAQRLLQAVTKRDAHWYYLSGCLALRNGMYNDAYNFFRTASNKDPQNDEYRAAYMRMEQQAGGYRNYGGNMQQQDCCNCCSNLIIADCCCECLGGDLISCC